MSTNESETEMTEQTYTRADMARAWDEGAETAWQGTCEGWNGETAGEEYTTLYGVAPFREANDGTTNPYEQEESMSKHETHVVPVNEDRHAYCDCGWRDLWLPDGKAAYDSADAHKRRHEQEEA